MLGSLGLTADQGRVRGGRRSARPGRAERITLDQGQELLAREFRSVIRHDLPGQLRIPGPEPVLDYVRSMSVVQSADARERVTRAIAGRLEFSSLGYLPVNTHAGWLTCS